MDKVKVKLVIVNWVDSRQPDPAWKHLSETGDYENVECASVGWMIRNSEDVIVLAPNVGDVNDSENIQISGEITIPAKSVLSICHLEKTNEASSCQPDEAAVKYPWSVEDFV